MSVGGSMKEVSIRGRIFAVASDGDANIDLGGYEAEVRANGNGTARKILLRKPWLFENVVLSIDDNQGDQEFLQEVENSTDFVDITVTYVNDVVYGGSGTVTGKIAKSTQAGTATLSLSGPGEAVQQ